MYSNYECLSARPIDFDEARGRGVAISVLQRAPGGVDRVAATFFGNNYDKVRRRANRFAEAMCDAAVEEAF